MPDSDVSITAGTGTKIDTRTVGAGVDEHRQVVVIGDPTTAANVGKVSSAGAAHVAQGPASAAATTSVNDAAVSTTLLASNANRRGVIIHNNSTSILYVKYGATASATSYTYKVPADTTLEMADPAYQGVIDGIWSADSTGFATITELT